MSALYNFSGNILVGNYQAEEVEARFEASRDGRSIRISVILLDGTLELGHLGHICQIVRSHIQGPLGLIIRFENLTIFVPPFGSLTDRLSISSLGIGGFTLSELLDISREIGYFHAQPTPARLVSPSPPQRAWPI